MADIERKPRVSTRPPKRTTDDYRSSLLEMLGMASPYEHGITKARTDIAIAPPPRSTETESRFPSITDLPRETSDGETAVTAGLVQRLWQATEAVDQELIIEDWGPESPLDRTVGRYRWAWWPVLLGVLVIGIVLVISNLRGIPVSQAADLRADWTAAAANLESSIPAARDAAEVITSPSALPEQLAEARNSLITFDSSAATLRSLVSRPFPTPPPLASGNAFDALKPAQADLQAGTQTVNEIQDLLSDAITYRSLIEGSFQLPPLPIVADEVTLSNLGEQIATAVSSTRAAVRQLPIGPSFDTHRTTAQAIVTRLESWQAAYLDALRLSDIDAATALKTEISDRIIGLRNTVSEPLGLVATEVSAGFDELGVLLDGAIADLAASE